MTVGITTQAARQEDIHLFLRLSSKYFNNLLLYFLIRDLSLYKRETHSLSDFNIYFFIRVKAILFASSNDI